MIKNLFKIIFLILYYAFATHLPNYSFPGGKFYNWLRVFCLKQILPIGKNCKIMRNVYVGDGNNIEIGNNCRINESVRLDNVKMGDHVMIARESILLSKGHETESIERPMVEQGHPKNNPIIIESDVWIGIRSIILPGVTIKHGSILGAGSILTKDTIEYSVNAGVPAKYIKKRKEL